MINVKRNIYLNSIDLTEIKAILNNLLDRAKYQVKEEEIETTLSLFRITYEAVYANVSSPFYSASAMDGVALKASSTYQATETTPGT